MGYTQRSTRARYLTTSNLIRFRRNFLRGKRKEFIERHEKSSKRLLQPPGERIGRRVAGVDFGRGGRFVVEDELVQREVLADARVATVDEVVQVRSGADRVVPRLLRRRTVHDHQWKRLGEHVQTSFWVKEAVEGELSTTLHTTLRFGRRSDSDIGRVAFLLSEIRG